VGGKTSTSTSQVSIPPEVLARYNAVNTRAEDVATNPFKQYGTTADAFVAPVNQQQTTGIANVNAAAGTAQPYIDAAKAATTAGMGSAQPGELDVSKYMNPYQQQVIDATMKQMGQANEQAQSGALGTAVSSGAFGGDRAGIAAANLANQQGMAMGSTLAGLNAQNYGQAVQTAQQQQGVTLGATQADLARFLQGGGQLANLGVTAQQAGLQGAEAQINAGTLQQQTEQAGKTALVNQFMQEQGYPFQVAQFLANIAMGTGSLSGSTTTSTQPTPFFSDRRLKEDIKRIGNTDDGLPIYKFKYKGDDSHQTHVGFMADEVEQKKPEAVGLHPSGYKTVDYDKATRNSMGGGVMPERAGQGFAEGGIAGPYGSSAGSQVDFGGYVPQAYLPVGGLMMADPALMDNSNRNLAALMEKSSNFGSNLQKLDEQFGKDGTFWDMFRKQDDEYASGGAAYLKTPSGGLAPNSAKSYLADTIESQNNAEKPELMTAQGGGSDRKSPAENVLDLGKMAMTIFGFQNGGRTGYADGGNPYDALERMMPEEKKQYTADLRAFATRDPSIIRSANEGGLNPTAYLGNDAATPTADLSYRNALSVMSDPEYKQYRGDIDAFNIRHPGTIRRAEDTGTNPRSVMAERPPTGLSPDGTRVGPTIENAAAISRPAPTVPAPTMGDLNAAGIGAAKMPAAPAEPTGVAKAAIPANGPLTDTGNVPEGGYDAIVPLGTQLDFVMHELQQPAYNGYLKRDYRTPSEAAIAFDAIYERSGGAGNKIAAANAEDIYAAAASGDMSGLPPNVATAYNHFVQGGMDPIQAAGAAGRLMVESYSHLDPNARNTMGGGNGTYGIAQWRGDRMENLANFAGVPFDALTGAPVSTPEGRYYSSGSGGDGYSGGLSRSTSNGEEGGRGLGLGKFLKENAGNKDFLLSLLSGLGTMASSPSLYLGSALLQGVGGAANTYMAREQQRGEITKQNIDNMYQIAQKTMDWNAMNPENQITPAQMAKIVGMDVNFPETATVQDIMSGAYTPTTGSGLEKIDYQTFQNGVVDIDGRTVRMQDDPVSLQRFILDNGGASPDSWIGREVARAETRLAQIEASGGMTTDANDQQFQIPGYTSVGDTQALAQANREASAEFRAATTEEINASSRQLASIGTLEGIYSKMEAGKFANVGAETSAVLSALDPGNFTGWQKYDLTDPAQYEIAMKGAGEIMASRLSTLPGGAPKAGIELLSTVTPMPDMQPDAIKKLLAIAKAEAKYRMAMYRDYDPAVHGTDVTKYTKEFAANGERFQEYLDEALASMPEFAGERGSEVLTADNAPDGSTDVDTNGRPIIKKNGKWVLQP